MTAGKRDALDWLDEALSELERNLLRRFPLSRRGPQGPAIEADDRRRLLNFGSNDYLALAGDVRLLAAAAATKDGFGAGASPLVVGRSESHARLEEQLADFVRCESALLFSSGFAANVGTIAALVGPGDTVYSDALNHASIIDGCRLSGARVAVYRHADVDHLRGLLSEDRTSRRRLLVSDSLFSMDGDEAPLADLAALADEYGCMWMLDEAHATGGYGSGGQGLAEARGVADRVDVHVGTLSKALGCGGGFVAGRRTLTQWLLNRSRPHVFSTALPPPVCAAAQCAVRIVQQEPQRREALHTAAGKVRTALARQGWAVGPGTSYIAPVIVGDAQTALDLAAALRRRGVFVPAIRPPSVPPGTARLRLSLSAGHRQDMLDELLGAMAQLAPQFLRRGSLP